MPPTPRPTAPAPRELPAQMTAVLTQGHGGYEQLDYRTDVPLPVPGPEDVLVRVGAAGINNTDINTRIGWYSSSVRGATDERDGPAADLGLVHGWMGTPQQFPRIQGADVCGRIIAAGPAVVAARLGERVLVQCSLRSLKRGDVMPFLGSERDGGFAQYVAVPAADAFAVHSALSDAELASFPCAYGTAENLLARCRVEPGERVLVTGASGGVGSAAVQLAARRGAIVVAIAGPDKAAQVRALGASQVIARGENLIPLVGGESIDAVIDVVGGPSWGELLDVLRRHGRYAASGAIAGPIVELDLRKLYLKDLSFHGCTDLDEGVFANLIGYIERGEVRPLVARSYPLADIALAQREFLAKRYVGKLVLLPP